MPTLSLLHEVVCPPTDGEVWLFAIPDGDPAGSGTGDVVLSVEYTDAKVQKLRVARVDPLDPNLFGTTAVT